jgi:hypothetical protein
MTKHKLSDGQEEKSSGYGFLLPGYWHNWYDKHRLRYQPATVGRNGEYLVCVVQFLHVWKSDDPGSVVVLKEHEFDDTEVSKIAVNPQNPCEFVSYISGAYSCVWKLTEPQPEPPQKVTNKRPADSPQARRVLPQTCKSENSQGSSDA